jgi:hypothetical protein
MFDSINETTVSPGFHLNEYLSSIVDRNNIHLAFMRPEVGSGNFVTQFLHHKRPISNLACTSDTGWEPQFSAR